VAVLTRLAWYKRYPADFREGTRRLTFEERGFYGDVLDLIYESGNALVDDDAANAHRLHADLRTFRRLKARLVGLGKLYLADGTVRNARADAEASTAASRIAMARDHAKLGGEKSRKSGTKPGFFNGSGGAGAQAGAQAGAEAPSREVSDRREEGKKESLPPPSESPPCAHTREEPAPAGPVVATSSLLLIRSKEGCSEAGAEARWRRAVKAAEGDEGLAEFAVDLAYHEAPLGVALTKYAIGVCRRQVNQEKALLKAALESRSSVPEEVERQYQASMQVLYDAGYIPPGKRH
jgi:uncharacterized protein YdaU (DUF1376 family)